MSHSSHRGRDPTSRTDDQQRFDAEFARYLPRVHAFVSRRVRQRSEVQALVEEILVAAFCRSGRPGTSDERDRVVFRLTREALVRYGRSHPPRSRPPRGGSP